MDTMIKTLSEYGCPIETPMKYIGKKWSINILRDLFEGRSRFSQFLEDNPKLSTKMLSARLRELEKEGFIEKRVVSTTPLVAEYALTKKGRALNRVLFELSLFSLNNCTEEVGKYTQKGKERVLEDLKKILGV